jgi:hypothetical protein
MPQYRGWSVPGRGRANPHNEPIFIADSNRFWTIISTGQELGYSPRYCPDRNWTGIRWLVFLTRILGMVGAIDFGR